MYKNTVVHHGDDVDVNGFRARINITTKKCSLKEAKMSTLAEGKISFTNTQL